MIDGSSPLPMMLGLLERVNIFVDIAFYFLIPLFATG
jgi:hypothetical protein